MRQVELGSEPPELDVVPRPTTTRKVWIQTFAIEYLNFQNLEMMAGSTVISGVINYSIADLHLLINLLQL